MQWQLKCHPWDTKEHRFIVVSAVENYKHCWCHIQTLCRNFFPTEDLISSQKKKKKNLPRKSLTIEKQIHVTSMWNANLKLNYLTKFPKRQVAKYLWFWPLEPVCLFLCTTESVHITHSPYEGLDVDSIWVDKTASQLCSSVPIFSPFSF